MLRGKSVAYTMFSPFRVATHQSASMHFDACLQIGSLSKALTGARLRNFNALVKKASIGSSHNIDECMLGDSCLMY
jgi:hypothetical protein